MPTKLSVAVDLDGVIAQYDRWEGVKNIGPPIDGAREFIAELRQHFRVILHTARMNPTHQGKPTHELNAILMNWCRLHDIEADQIWWQAGKPVAFAYIDDRAVICRPQDYDQPQVVFNNVIQGLVEELERHDEQF